MNLLVGDIVFHAYAFPDTGKFTVTKYSLVKVGTTMRGVDAPSVFVRDCTTDHVRELSLKDANVLPNTYNCHRIFKTLLEVENYVNNPELWRPLGFTVEEWANGGKADYLEQSAMDGFLDYLSATDYADSTELH